MVRSDSAIPFPAHAIGGEEQETCEACVLTSRCQGTSLPLGPGGGGPKLGGMVANAMHGSPLETAHSRSWRWEQFD